MDHWTESYDTGMGKRNEEFTWWWEYIIAIKWTLFLGAGKNIFSSETTLQNKPKTM